MGVGTKEAAEFLGVTAACLRQRRRRKQGPKYTKSCGQAVYKKADLLAYQVQRDNEPLLADQILRLFSAHENEVFHGRTTGDHAWTIPLIEAKRLCEKALNRQ